MIFVNILELLCHIFLYTKNLYLAIFYNISQQSGQNHFRSSDSPFDENGISVNDLTTWSFQNFKNKTPHTPPTSLSLLFFFFFISSPELVPSYRLPSRVGSLTPGLPDLGVPCPISLYLCSEDGGEGHLTFLSPKTGLVLVTIPLTGTVQNRCFQTGVRKKIHV